MRTFKLIRRFDQSGVSGIGHVLDGVVFENGKTVVSWRSKHPTVTMYDSFLDFWEVHCGSHPQNKSEVTFEDGELITEEAQIKDLLFQDKDREIVHQFAPNTPKIPKEVFEMK